MRAHGRKSPLYNTIVVGPGLKTNSSRKQVYLEIDQYHMRISKCDLPRALQWGKKSKRETGRRRWGDLEALMDVCQMVTVFEVLSTQCWNRLLLCFAFMISSVAFKIRAYISSD